MTGLLVAVLGLALIDSVNPSAIAVTLYLLLTGRSYAARVLTYIAAVFATYFVIGVLLMLGLDAIWGYLYSPVAYAVQGVVGALMLLYGIFAPGETGKERATQMPWSQSLGAIFLLGVTITVVEFSTALPYLGASAILTNADLTAVQWVSILTVYNLIFVLPPILLLVSYRLLGSRLRRRFDRHRRRLWRDFFGLVEVPDIPRGS